MSRLEEIEKAVLTISRQDTKKNLKKEQKSNGSLQQSKLNLNVASWNIEGIKKHTESINELIETYSPDIICLQEIQTLQLEEHHYNNILESYSTVFNTQDKYRKGLQKIQLSKNRQHFGTSISTKTKYDKQIKLLNTKIHNIQAMKLNIGEDNILFLNENLYLTRSQTILD